MAVTTNILATYRGPGRVVARLLQAGQREDRALAMLMAGCLLVFVSGWPEASRRAHLEGIELNPILGASLFSWIFVAPLIFYALAALSHVIARIFGGKGSFYSARLALFWALLAIGPLTLLNGLVEGFVGEGPVQIGVGALWLAGFLWFWIAGLVQAEKPVEGSE